MNKAKNVKSGIMTLNATNPVSAANGIGFSFPKENNNVKNHFSEYFP